MIEEKTKVSNRMPLRIHPSFISKLIALQRRYRHAPSIKVPLETAVTQCRNFNREDNPATRERLWFEMNWLQKGLAQKGVIVG